MARKYSIRELMDLVGLDESTILDMIESGEVSAEEIDGEIRVELTEIVKSRLRMAVYRSRVQGPAPSYCLLDDGEFIEFLCDLFDYKTNEVLERLGNYSLQHQADLDEARTILADRMDHLQHSLNQITEVEYDKEAIGKIEKIMTGILEKALADMPGKTSGGNGSTISRESIAELSAVMEKVIDKKLAKINGISVQISKLEGLVTSGDQKIIENIKKSMSSNPVEEINAQMEAFVEFINENLNEMMETIKIETRDLKLIRGNIDTTKPEFQGGSPDNAIVFQALKDLGEGQIKIRKILTTLNTSLQRSLKNKLGEIKKVTEEFPGLIEEIREILPTFQDIVEDKVSRVDGLIKPLEDLREHFTVDGQEDLIQKFNSIQKAIEGTDLGALIPHVDEKFVEFKRNMEMVFVQLGGRQQKSFMEKLDKIKLSPEAFDSINQKIDEIESLFNDFTDIFEERYGRLEQLVKRINIIEMPGAGDPGKPAISSIEPGLIEKRLDEFQDSIKNVYGKLDSDSIRDVMGEVLGEKVASIQESQESFQKMVLNLNVNNQKAIVEKLEQLDRLNELIPVRDSVDEIAEQIQTFEAIMADVNQLVDERLQSIEGLHEAIAGINPNYAGDSSSKMGETIKQLNSLLDSFQNRFSTDGIIKSVRSIIDEQSEELKENQEAAQKILLNLNVNSQKYLMERLDEINQGFESVKEAKKQFTLLENLIPSISDLIDIKLRKIGDTKYNTGRLAGDQEMAEIFGRIQKAIENEAKTVRNAVESSQKIVMNLGVNNHKLLMEKINSLGISKEIIEEIAYKNKDVLSMVIGQLDPGRTIASSLSDLREIIGVIKDNLVTENSINKVLEMIKYQGAEARKEQKGLTQAISQLSNQVRSDMISRIEQIQKMVNDLSSSMDPESIISNMGDLVIEGNEALKDNQQALLNLQMKSHKELMECMTLSRSGDFSGGTGGPGVSEVLPIIERLFEESMNGFKRDMDGANKVLVNLNVNLQKQLLMKIRELLNDIISKGVKFDSDSLMKSINYLMEEKMNDIKENQEALLSLNLSTQKALKEKLEYISRSPGSSSEALTDDLNSLLPLIERIVADKIRGMWDSYNDAQSAMEKLAVSNHHQLIEKLETIEKKAGQGAGPGEIQQFLPNIKEALDETCRYMNDFKNDLEAVTKNIELQDPRFLNKQLSDIREVLSVSNQPVELIARLEDIINASLGSHREAMGILGEKIDSIYEILSVLQPDQNRQEVEALKQLFTTKIEETRELERQLVQTFRQMHAIFRREYDEGEKGKGEREYLQQVLVSIDDTRKDQEKLLDKVDMLSSLLKTMPTSQDSVQRSPMVDNSAMTELIDENDRLAQTIELIEKEKEDILRQLKSARRAVNGTDLDEKIKEIMYEKDRLLEECYKEKVELRELLEAEKRDKYELIQRYETEKKELIDSLALERIQREKDKADLEYLRGESRKKKWW